MTDAMVGILLESFLRSAIESAVILRRMGAEGRTHTTIEEEKQLQDATDAAAAAARKEGEDL